MRTGLAQRHPERHLNDWRKLGAGHNKPNLTGARTLTTISLKLITGAERWKKVSDIFVVVLNYEQTNSFFIKNKVLKL